MLLFPGDNGALLIDSIAARRGMKKNQFTLDARDVGILLKSTKKVEQHANQCGGNWNINKRIIAQLHGGIAAKLSATLLPRPPVLTTGY